ncbi:hypothetical protein PoB_002204900 [Plakobranchus ocellatus]|uniref:Uncharacterized protein n=1 Tax=Plakobranchus ocellatus TaxID=259542 RepID=A0AAV3ZNT7_9GAST|nr:hypothetical protein PoB_002204900 [Plakobranchus ocellatus]
MIPDQSQGGLASHCATRGGSLQTADTWENMIQDQSQGGLASHCATRGGSLQTADTWENMIQDQSQGGLASHSATRGWQPTNSQNLGEHDTGSKSQSCGNVGGG